MKYTYAMLLTIPLIFSLPTSARGQEGLEDILKEMVSENAKGYLNPLVTAFGTGMNSGTFHRAKPHKVLGFDLTFNVTVTTIPESALEYEFLISDKLIDLKIPSPLGGGGTVDVALAFSDIYQTGIMSQSFFGATDNTNIPVNSTATFSAIVGQVATTTGLTADQVETAVGTDISTAVGNISALSIPGGIGFAVWPTLMPQFALGLPFGTEVMFRGFSTETPDGDPIKFSGFGAKISLSQFIPIPLFPVAISAGLYVSSVNLADIVTASNSILTLQTSFSVPVFTLYGGIGLESSEMAVLLETDTGETLLDFSLEGENAFRTIVGLRIKLLLLSFHADYSAGEYPSITVGIGLTLR